MIETYKILSGKYDLEAVPILTTSTTRFNDLKSGFSDFFFSLF